MKSEYRKYNIVMIICILLGGFSLVFYFFQMYESFWRPGMSEVFRNDMNFTEFNNLSFPRDRVLEPPGVRLASPLSIFLLLNGIVLLVAGISLWALTRDREIHSTKEKLTSLLLLPEERAVILELKKSKGAMTQSQLVRNTGMSKVKTHRIVNRLAAKGIIKKYPYGLTNKIVLEKEI